jgi:hypothetical protein
LYRAERDRGSDTLANHQYTTPLPDRQPCTPLRQPARRIVIDPQTSLWAGEAEKIALAHIEINARDGLHLAEPLG